VTGLRGTDHLSDSQLLSRSVLRARCVAHPSSVEDWAYSPLASSPAFCACGRAVSQFHVKRLRGAPQRVVASHA
jgi:hypothetical protein